MLYTIAVILLVAWLLGFVGLHTVGSFIHLLLVVAIVLFLVRLLSGRAHLVHTGVALVSATGIQSAVDTTRVWFDAMTDEDISWYVATGEPVDRAGAYAIEPTANAAFRAVNRLLAAGLRRLDEGPSHVARLDEPLAIRQPDLLRIADGRCHHCAKEQQVRRVQLSEAAGLHGCEGNSRQRARAVRRLGRHPPLPVLEAGVLVEVDEPGVRREAATVEGATPIGTDWLRSKNAPGFTPLGPWIVPAEFVGDAGRRALRDDLLRPGEHRPRQVGDRE